MEKSNEAKKNKKFIQKILANKFVKKFLANKFVKKVFTREIILYAIFGIVTTIINIGSFYIMTEFFNIDENLANNIAIVIAVLIAYFTNKDMVFHSQARGFKEKIIEFFRFILGRLFTMVVESVGGSLLFEFVPIPTIISKCLITVVVIILNFFISKFFAFKKPQDSTSNV